LLAEAYTGANAINEDLIWKAATTEDKGAKVDVMAHIERLLCDACGLLRAGENGVNLTLAAIHLALSCLYTEHSNALGEEQSRAMRSKAMMAAKQACRLAGVGTDLPSEARCISERLIVWDDMHRFVASSALLQFAQCCGPLQPGVRKRDLHTENKVSGSLSEDVVGIASKRESKFESNSEKHQAFAVYLACVIQASGTGVDGLQMSGPLGLLVHAASKGDIWQGHDRDMVLQFVERVTSLKT
jgi:hypothetical protein